MTARAIKLSALCLGLWLGCASDDDVRDAEDVQPPPVREEAPKKGAPCDTEDEQVCDAEGVLLYKCEGVKWTAIVCPRYCRDLVGDQCSLGCLISREGDDCLCGPCG